MFELLLTHSSVTTARCTLTYNSSSTYLPLHRFLHIHYPSPSLPFSTSVLLYLFIPNITPPPSLPLFAITTLLSPCSFSPSFSPPLFALLTNSPSFRETKAKETCTSYELQMLRNQMIIQLLFLVSQNNTIMVMMMGRRY